MSSLESHPRSPTGAVLLLQGTLRPSEAADNKQLVSFVDSSARGLHRAGSCKVWIRPLRPPVRPRQMHPRKTRPKYHCRRITCPRSGETAGWPHLLTAPSVLFVRTDDLAGAYFHAGGGSSLDRGFSAIAYNCYLGTHTLM